MADQIRAGGAVLWRPADGHVEVALVHRPKYDDWSLPKGKLEAGEDEAAAAVREVLEETGFHGSLGEPLGEVRYLHRRHGRRRPKVVRYWAMRAEAGGFTPHAEVDEVRWLGLPEAARQLSYNRDREVLERFERSADRGILGT